MVQALLPALGLLEHQVIARLFLHLKAPAHLLLVFLVSHLATALLHFQAHPLPSHPAEALVPRPAYHLQPILLINQVELLRCHLARYPLGARVTNPAVASTLAVPHPSFLQ